MSNKMSGVVLGTAIGDALGYPVEFMSVDPASPTVDGFVRIEKGIALYSDDTQMFRAVLEGLIRARTWDDLDKAAEEIAEEFIAWSRSPENNRAPGSACMAGCASLAKGTPWQQAGKFDSKGCGTAMRSMAYGMWFPGDPDSAAEWAARHALMTHQSDEACAAAAAVAAMVSVGIKWGDPLDMLGAALVAADRHDWHTVKLIEEAGAAPHNPQIQCELLDKWRGWTGAEAVAASIYCLLSYPKDYRKAVLMAVNTPGDSDSLGAITGALVGSVVGYEGIPSEWVGPIEKREELFVLAQRVCSAVKIISG